MNNNNNNNNNNTYNNTNNNKINNISSINDLILKTQCQQYLSCYWPDFNQT